jgi:prepilin-type N-terminal cleavage/methylation domain-containing protein
MRAEGRTVARSVLLASGLCPLPSRGFTLAESLVAAVVLAIAVVGVSGALIASQQQTRSQEDDGVAVSLGKQLLEEIASHPLVLGDGTTGQPGWPAVTDRSAYDTVGDFDGYRDLLSCSYERERSIGESESFNTLTANPPTTVIAPGATLDPLAKWQFRREVSLAYPTSAFGATFNAGDLVLVTVQVTSASGRQVKFSRIIARTSIYR